MLFRTSNLWTFRALVSSLREDETPIHRTVWGFGDKGSKILYKL